MKKALISALAAVAIMGCSESATDDAAAYGGEAGTGSYVEHICIGAAASSDDTRAAYDENLDALWEHGDRIKVLHGFLEYSLTQSQTVEASLLDLTDGDGTGSARFEGDITVTGNDSYYHSAYPAEASELYIKRSAASVGTNNSTTTCRITIPSEQNGEWTPYMWASTSSAVSLDNLEGFDYNVLNGAICIRVFENDRTTPKRIKSITIESTGSQLVGTFSATAERTAALGAFSFSGNSNAITADNLDTIEKTGDHYEYRFEVAPVTVEGLAFTITDPDGSVITRTVGAKTFAANRRSGYNIYWDAASITMSEATSWYESYATNPQTELATGTVFANGIRIQGVGPGEIAKAGIEINGAFYHTTTALEYDMAIGSFASGEYTVNAYAQLEDGKELRSESQTVHVTATIPAIESHTIRSSYNSNGTTAMTNDLDGSRIYAAVTLNDPYVQSSLVSSTTLYYGQASQAGAAGNEFQTEATAWGRYDNCHVSVVLGNGYTIDTPAYTVNVTGIPYYLDPDSATPAGWSTSNTSEWSGHIRFNTTDAYAISPTFFVPEPFNVNASISAYAYGGTIYGNYKPAVYISASSSGIASGEATTLSGSNLLPNAGASYHDISRTLGLGSVNNVCIFTSGKKGSSWTIGTNGVVVRSISITY